MRLISFVSQKESLSTFGTRGTSRSNRCFLFLSTNLLGTPSHGDPKRLDDRLETRRASLESLAEQVDRCYPVKLRPPEKLPLRQLAPGLTDKCEA